MRKLGFVIIFVLSIVLLSCLSSNNTILYHESISAVTENTPEIIPNVTITPTIKPTIEPTSTPTQTPIDYKVKYIFLFIGDGMGNEIIRLSNDILIEKENRTLSFTEFESQGTVSTTLYNGGITDSAAAGTAISSGVKTYKGAIGIDINGEKTQNILEYVSDKGMKTGVITTVTVDHATPAAFYAHQSKRTMYDEILVDVLKSDLNVLAGSNTSAKLSHDELLKEAEGSDFELRFVGKDDTFPDEKGIYLTHIPFLKDNDSSKSTLNNLLRHTVVNLYNDKGFFIMAESGRIDWANHESDWIDAVNEVYALNDAVMYALDFYKKHPNETLILVTSDHETGGFIYDDNANVDVYNGITSSYENLSQAIIEAKNKGLTEGFQYLKDYLTKNYSFGFNDVENCVIPISNKDEDAIYNAFKYYIRRKSKAPSNVYDVVYQIINDYTRETYTTDYHTKEPVSIYALGRYSDLFEGEYDNSDIYHKLTEIIDINIQSYID